MAHYPARSAISEGTRTWGLEKHARTAMRCRLTRYQIRTGTISRQNRAHTITTEQMWSTSRTVPHATAHRSTTKRSRPTDTGKKRTAITATHILINITGEL